MTYIVISQLPIEVVVGHHATLDDILDHRCVGQQVLVRIQSKRSHAAIAMTLDAVPLHDGGYRACSIQIAKQFQLQSE